MNKEKTKDQYQWLEKDSRKVRSWIRAQEKPTSKYLSQSPFRKILRKKFKHLFDIDSIHTPVQRENLYFFRWRKVNEDQPKLYVKKRLHGKPTLLLDPNKLKLGTIQGWDVSKDARFIEISFSKASNDHYVLKIFDVLKRKFLKDTITSERYPYFQKWDPDSMGFWYLRGEPGHSISDEKYYKRIYYHKLGTPVRQDTIFFEKTLLKDDFPSIDRSHDGRYTTITVYHKNETSTVYFKDTVGPKKDFVNISRGMSALSYIAVENNCIYLNTDHKAPNRKILKRKIYQGSLGEWEIFVPERNYKLENWVLLNEKILLEYIENISSKICLIDLKTKKSREVKLPGAGSVDAYSSEYGSEKLFFSFDSLNVPSNIYILDTINLKLKSYWKPKINLPTGLNVEQKWTKSKDGTKIPMFTLTNGKKYKNRPTLVYGYGGFGISLLPSFRSSVIPFIESGGMYVLANIRGGGEFGKKWHEAAIKAKQHKRFEDFAAVLKYLSDQDFTSPEKICVWGGSNGGLLMSVMALKYPGLFKAAVIDVPVTDMLGFHLFHGGRHWIHDYGDPDDKKMRKYLLSYSPYHNVGNQNYPSILLMTGEHDDRVHPMHTYKFFAKLKENRNQRNPILLRINKKAGHGGAGKVKANINTLTDMFTFVYKELGIT